MYREAYQIPKAFLWIIGITTVTTLVMMVAVASQTGWSAEILWSVVGMTVLQVFTAWLLRRPCRIEVAPSGISIRYRPFNLGPKRIDWSEVRRMYHQKVDPMGDFMGYGVRMKGWKKEGRVIAYAFEEGNYVFVERHQGSTVAFQITQPEAWSAVLNDLEARGIIVER